MAFNFKDSFKKIADATVGTKANGDTEKKETRKGFQDYGSFPAYDVPEPAQWTGMQGEERSFTIEGNVIEVNANLDTCMKYYPLFVECAKYYTDRFKFKYAQCATDFDSFLNYFESMYMEGLIPMLQRAYSLFLPLGVYDMEYEKLRKAHSEKYHAAIDAYNAVAGIREERVQKANSLAQMSADSRRIDSVMSSSAKGLRKASTKAQLHNLGTMALSYGISAYINRLKPEEKREFKF